MRRILAASTGTLVLAGLAVLAPPGRASAGAEPYRTRTRTQVVPPGGSIQAAVDRARPGDVIRLKAGHYDGGVLVRKRLIVHGEGRDTVIRPGRTGGGACARAHLADTGICVIGRANRPVTGVTVKDLTVRGFKRYGVIGDRTDRLAVEGVFARGNGAYGIAGYRSTRGRFLRNQVFGNRAEAGLYVGDIADARDTEVAENLSAGNALGLLVRDARHVKVWGNKFVHNCTGVALVDDAQEGGGEGGGESGQGETGLWHNDVSYNNRYCAQSDELPALGGTGVLFFGGDHNVAEDNVVDHNRGKLSYSGGIVLFPGLARRERPAEHTVIKHNQAYENAPSDIVDESDGERNAFQGNFCHSSDPDDLC